MLRVTIKADSTPHSRSNPAAMDTTRSFLINAGSIVRTANGNTAWKRPTRIAAITNLRGHRALGPPSEMSIRVRQGPNRTAS